MHNYKVKNCHSRNHYEAHDSFYRGYTHREEQILKDGIITAEKAYRRGVAQTLAMLSYLAEGTINKKLLEKMQYRALTMRTDGKAYPELLHTLLEEFGIWPPTK